MRHFLVGTFLAGLGIFFVFVAVALSGCRGHRVAMKPILAPSPGEIQTSTTPATARADKSQSGEQKMACDPGRWRRVVNNAFTEHEMWPFQVQWGVLNAGQAVLAVEGIEPVRGRPAYHLSMDIRATGVAARVHPFRDRTDSWLDAASLTTVLIRHSVREGHYQADESAILDQACRRFQKRKERLDKVERDDRQGPLPPDALDVYGILFYLRTLPLAVGQAYDLELFTGEKAVPVTAFVRKKEKLKVGAGTFDCFQVDMISTSSTVKSKIRQVRWWIGAEAPHPPVRIRMDIPLGHITADLEK